MRPNWKAVAWGFLGAAALALVLWLGLLAMHLYQDHLLVDGFRAEILANRARQAQPAPSPSPKAEEKK